MTVFCIPHSVSKPVPSKYPPLLARLKAATRPLRKKSELATFLGVPQSRVSEWLNGKYEPGGEITLQLLQWVEDEEAKQKSPGAVTSGAEGKQTRERTRNAIQSNPPAKK